MGKQEISRMSPGEFPSSEKRLQQSQLNNHLHMLVDRIEFSV